MPFFACYLLQSDVRPAATYVGFTNNPKRRIRQHNGEIKGGAKRTRIHRPWHFVGMVWGFIDNIAALQFEWAWQHPRRSKIVREANARLPSSLRGVEKQMMILLTMLDLEPWRNYNLRVHFLEQRSAQIAERLHLKRRQIFGSLARSILPSVGSVAMLPVDPADFAQEDDAEFHQSQPTSQRCVEQGGARVQEGCSGTANGGGSSLGGEDEDDGTFFLTEDEEDDDEDEVGAEDEGDCFLCSRALTGRVAGCHECALATHVCCLARHFLPAGSGRLIPTDGACPRCTEQLDWAEIVRRVTVRPPVGPPPPVAHTALPSVHAHVQEKGTVARSGSPPPPEAVPEAARTGVVEVDDTSEDDDDDDELPLMDRLSRRR